MRLLERARVAPATGAFAWASLLIGAGAACLIAVLSLPTWATVLAHRSASWRRRCG